MAALYRADPPALRVTAAADAMTLIYHRPSGITHVVASPVPEILDALDEGPADARSILARLAVAHDLFGEEEAGAAIAARLDEMAAAGLVARA